MLTRYQDQVSTNKLTYELPGTMCFCKVKEFWCAKQKFLETAISCDLEIWTFWQSFLILVMSFRGWTGRTGWSP